jgi:hypothetical protein
MVVPIFAGKGSLGPFVDAHVILHRREPLPKIRLLELLHEETRTPEPFKTLARSNFQAFSEARKGYRGPGISRRGS